MRHEILELSPSRRESWVTKTNPVSISRTTARWFGIGNNREFSLILLFWVTACVAPGNAQAQTQSFDTFGGAGGGTIAILGDSLYTTRGEPFASGLNVPAINLNNTGSISASVAWGEPAAFGTAFALSDVVVTTTGSYTISFNAPSITDTATLTPYIGVNTVPDVDATPTLTVGDLRALGIPATLSLNAGDRLVLGYDVETGSSPLTTTSGILWNTPGLITIILLTSDPNQALAEMSANATGTFLPNAQSAAQNDITHTALNAVHNQRIVRARSQMGNPRCQQDTLANADRKLGRYLSFARTEGLTLRQALGLEEIPASGTLQAGTLSQLFSIEEQAGCEVCPDPKRWELYAVGDFGSFDQDFLNPQNQGFRSRTFASSVGVEYLVNPCLNVGAAFTYGDNETDLNGGLGNVKIEGQLYSVYATMFRDNRYLDVMYSYGDFENTLVRNTLVAGNATGTPDSDSHTVSFNMGQNFDFCGLVTGPTLGFDYTTGTVEAYNETGGGIAALNYEARRYKSAISSLGWQVSKTKCIAPGVLTLQAFTSWDHEHNPDDGPIRATLANFGAVNLNQPGAAGGTDWMVLGAGAHLATCNGWNFSVDYQTQLFRDDIEAHYVGAKISAEF